MCFNKCIYCLLAKGHKGAVERLDSWIDACCNIRFEKHLHFSCREHVITFSISLCLPLTLPLLSESNTAKTSALCMWVSLLASQQPETPWMAIWWGTHWKQSGPAVTGELFFLHVFFRPLPTPLSPPPHFLSVSFFCLSLLLLSIFSVKQKDTCYGDRLQYCSEVKITRRHSLFMVACKVLQ